jgi:hypothetical protein
MFQRYTAGWMLCLLWQWSVISDQRSAIRKCTLPPPSALVCPCTYVSVQPPLLCCTYPKIRSRPCHCQWRTSSRDGSRPRPHPRLKTQDQVPSGSHCIVRQKAQQPGPGGGGGGAGYLATMQRTPDWVQRGHQTPLPSPLVYSVSFNPVGSVRQCVNQTKAAR